MVGHNGGKIVTQAMRWRNNQWETHDYSQEIKSAHYHLDIQILKPDSQVDHVQSQVLKAVGFRRSSFLICRIPEIWLKGSHSSGPKAEMEQLHVLHGFATTSTIP